jgi:deferrochelatase/peroxidase EfeB
MSRCPFSPTRRGILGAAIGLAGAAGAATFAAAEADHPPLIKTAELPHDRILPFHGAHQNGIATPMQGHTYFAAFDIVSEKRSDVAAMLQRWTEAAATLTQGQPLAAYDAPDAPPGDSGDVLGLKPSRLTLTFGFGPGLFTKDNADRFGLAKHRPAAFVDLPRFVGDQLDPARTGGDLSVQACGDDQQATMSAVRQLMRLAYGVATVRWVQAGFLAGYDPKITPRNLMGFKDGTFNVAVDDDSAMNQHIWVGDEGGAWMRGGTYAVARPIRIALEHWDRMKLAFQEQTIGRTKVEGAPIGKAHEFDAMDLDATDKDGNPVIAENAHIRLAAPQSNGGATILRRGYSYDNGISLVAERWPPWRHTMELDAGLLFICYQRDPRTGFIKIFDRMSKFDMLNQFVTHVGGGLFACPPGVQPGRYVGQDLMEA